MITLYNEIWINKFKKMHQEYDLLRNEGKTNKPKGDKQTQDTHSLKTDTSHA